MHINLVLQSFGTENEYRRAILTILSYFAYTSYPVVQSKVYLFTDCPDFFESYLKGLPVAYVPLDEAKIREMRGTIDFLHRIKIAVIEAAFSKTGGILFYADSDTFFIADPHPVVDRVSPQQAFMHLWEYRFSNMRELKLPMGKTFHAFLDLIERSTFTLSDGSRLRVDPEQVSWNAGVMVFHPEHARFIPDVYALTDQFYPASQNHASEQYAFSVMLQNNVNIEPCDAVIYHYWYRIKKQVIDLFLAKEMNKAWLQASLESRLEAVKRWTTALPAIFEKHPLMVQDRAIQAFNEDNFKEGYRYAFQVLKNAPFNTTFIKDLLYHSKRALLNQ